MLPPGADPVRVDVALPTSRDPKAPAAKLRSLRVSRDGTRAAYVVQRAPGHEDLYVGVVERSRRGSATVVKIAPDPVDIAPDLRSVLDVGWVDSATVVVLIQGPGDQAQRPRTVSVDGYVVTEQQQQLEGARTVTAAPGGRLVATTSDGDAWEWSRSSWTDLGPATAATFPG